MPKPGSSAASGRQTHHIFRGVQASCMPPLMGHAPACGCLPRAGRRSTCNRPRRCTSQAPYRPTAATARTRCQAPRGRPPPPRARCGGWPAGRGPARECGLFGAGERHVCACNQQRRTAPLATAAVLPPSNACQRGNELTSAGRTAPPAAGCRLRRIGHLMVVCMLSGTCDARDGGARAVNMESGLRDGGKHRGWERGEVEEMGGTGPDYKQSSVARTTRSSPVLPSVASPQCFEAGGDVDVPERRVWLAERGWKCGCPGLHMSSADPRLRVVLRSEQRTEKVVCRVAAY
eukprot:353182-Chlamydomonas_euryale.AAC.40